MASADLRKELDCSICLNIYTDPVTLRCGHNFCRVCIDGVLDLQLGSAHYACPECRKRFRSRPALQKNITLCNIVESFRSSHPEQKESGISCTYCIHASVPAVKSCLLCEASLCDNHLNVHSKSPEHVLSDPTASPDDRKCSVHKKVLVYYCTEDAACICVSCCLIGEHKGHQIESLEEAAEKKKKLMRNAIHKLGTKRRKTEKRVQSLQERKRKAQGKASGETERVTALFRDLRRQLEELEMRVRGEISGQAERVSCSVSDLIQQLEVQKDELCRRMRQMEELCDATDPLAVLQEPVHGGWFEEEGDEDVERQNKFLLTAGDLDVALISHTLHAGLSDIISGINGASYMQEIAEILLDVNTAGYYLHISDDQKTVSWSDISQNRPEVPERFQYAPQVLSSRGFSAGRHYWDADVSGSDEWRVGMCYPSMERKGIKSQSVIGSNNKSWCLHRTADQYLVVHDGNKTQLADSNSVERVRIYLDYEAGQISFYDLRDPIRHLHTFAATFTEPLLVALRVWEGCIRISGGKQEM
ncbi:PREDICTED: tripartite motif-containing protein 14-like [Nanorana parkeri]|uniref:tripartite motif-containing protein 14-like n=1 Tax=Nanorana parkeri TaxID=125878 RepID=UPI0008543AF2|nr:PREDICTED: tripartite motif-containing protein 14-like [Nanorana parkeri]